MRSLAEIQQVLGVSSESGLVADAVARSRARFGVNVLTPLPRDPAWQKFLEKFDEPIIHILLAAALLSMVVDLFKANTVAGGVALAVLAMLITLVYALRQARWIPALMFASALVLFGVGLASKHVFVEGLAVMVAVMLATGVAFASEYKSDREFELLNACKESMRAKVLREGQLQQLGIEEVLVGDLVLLETGDEIPADGRVVRAAELLVDQSLMTGESEPARKRARPDDTSDGPEQPSCLYRGTQVVDGAAQMVVTEVGDDTYLGQIARRLSAEDETDAEGRVRSKLSMSKDLTPLQQKLARLADLISKVGYIAAGLIFLAQVARGLLVGEIYWPTDTHGFLAVTSELLGYFVTMVIIVVVAVPEGLPMSVTVSLALAMRKMTRANSLVRQLVACETIGSATVICSDKTGTLTQNRMRVERVGWADVVHERPAPGWPPLDAVSDWPRNASALDWLILNAAVNSTAHLEQKNGRTVAVGNSTEAALLSWLRESGLAYSQLRTQFPSLYQIHFSSDRKRMTTIVRYGDRLVALVKGAPEWVIERSQSYQADDGRVREMTHDIRAAILTNLRAAASKAMRTLAFAHALLPSETAGDEDTLHALRDSLETGLIYTGFVAIRDPLRDDVKHALDQCRRAGIEVKMITGDNVETARAVGHEIGLVAQAEEPIDTHDAVILTSAHFNRLSDDELKKRLPGLRILARARPLDKFRMVRLLQELGEVVAVTGDGTNDAPALKKADVGLAMGIAGTEVAKEASKIVLLDDAFSTIVQAVGWGRALYENIQRFIQFQLTINVSALAIMFLGILVFQVKAPFTVLQLLWINVIMDTFASLALCSEPPRPGVMNQPPKRRDESIVTPFMVRTICVTGAFFVVTMLALLVLMRGDPERPGLFAGPGQLWSIELAGTRAAVPASELHHSDGAWRLLQAVSFGDEMLLGPKVDVEFTVLQVTLFFSIYVFFQVWNQVNCRSLTPRTSGLAGIARNPMFLAIAITVAVGQVLIVTLGGTVFKVEPLSPFVWLATLAGTSSVLVFAELVRRSVRSEGGAPAEPPA